jgi:hypothetical protein
METTGKGGILMSTVVTNSAYDRAVLNGIKTGNRIPDTSIDTFYRDYYPIFLHIYGKQVEPETYVKMLEGAFVKRISLDEVKDRISNISIGKTSAISTRHAKVYTKLLSKRHSIMGRRTKKLKIQRF